MGDAARSVEGYYRIQGSTDFCIERAKPILSQATRFAKEVREAVPHQMLAYNLSPSFNWDALSIDLFAREYATKGAAAYVQLIQRKEREHGVETLTHQKWSGSELVDEAGTIISGGMSSTGIMSAGVTETQFGAKK